MARLGLTPNISDPRKSNYGQTYGSSGGLNTTNISGEYGDEEDGIRPVRRAVGYGAPNIYGGQLPTVDVQNYAGFRQAKTNADENDLRTANRYGAVARNNASQAMKEGARALEFGNPTYGQGLVDRAHSMMPGLTPPPGAAGTQQQAAPTTYTQAQHDAFAKTVLQIMGQNKANPNFTQAQAEAAAARLHGYNPLVAPPAPTPAGPAFTGTAQERRDAENAHFAGPNGVGGTRDIGLTTQQQDVMRANNPQMSDDQFREMATQKYDVAANPDQGFGPASVPRPGLAPSRPLPTIVPESLFGTNNGLDYQQNHQQTPPPYHVAGDYGIGGGLSGINPANQIGPGARATQPSLAPPPTMGPPSGYNALPKQSVANAAGQAAAEGGDYVPPGRFGPAPIGGYQPQASGQAPQTTPSLATPPTSQPTTASEYPNGPDGKPDMSKKPVRRWRIYPDGRKELIGGAAQ